LLPEPSHSHTCQGKENSHLEGWGVWFKRRCSLLYCEEDVAEDHEFLIARKYLPHERDEEIVNCRLK